MKNVELYYEARALMKERKDNEALILLEKLEKINPQNSTVIFYIAKIKARSNKTQNEAAELFKSLLKESNKHASSALLELGKIEVSNRNYSQAKSYFNKLIRRENDSLAHIELAKLEVKLRNYNEAKSLLQISVDSDSKYKASALLELSKLERKLGNIEDAMGYLEEIPANAENIEPIWIELELAKLLLLSGEFDKGTNALKRLLKTPIQSEALTELVKAYIRIEKYDVAYKYNQKILEKHIGKISINPFKIDTFLKYKLGILDIDSEVKTYSSKQLVNYSKEEALKHIEKHLDEDDEKVIHSEYTEDIDINELFEFAQNKINDIEPCQGYSNEKYIIRCNKIIGKTLNDRLTDTVLVIVIPNTKNIINMYPIPAMNNEMDIEINKEKQNTKQKRKSQLDKFYDRYGIK